MGVELSYELIGTGWAKCTLEVDDMHVAVTASYLSDALEDLASALTCALRGHPRATASFAEGPGEYRWVLESVPGGRVRVRIIEFKDLWRHRPDEEGTEIFSAECRLRTFGGALLSELQRIERTYGFAGYRDKWVNYDFPKGRMTELQELLHA